MRDHLIAVAAGLAFAPAALAQDCAGQFDTSVGNPGVTPGNIADFHPFDAGNGEALYAAGSFTDPSFGVAAWDGQSWTGVGSISSDFATSLGAFDGLLFLGGAFSSVDGVSGTAKIAAWDGTEWLSVGASMSFLSSIWSFATFDDGAGEALYVGGNYIEIGGVPASRIARYDGQTWSALGAGVTEGLATVVLDIEVYDDGTGPALFVCGRFDNAGGVFTPLVAKWTGAEWQSVGGGLDGTQAVNLTVYDGDLYVTGSTITPFSTGEATSVARWDGQDWTSLGDPLGNLVWEVFPFDAGDGAGESLYAAGAFDDDVPSDTFKRWTGTEWVDAPFEFDDSIFAAQAWDDGSGPGVFLGGSFSQIDGEAASRAAKFIPCESACPADCNADGALNVLDFLCFQDQWQSQTEFGDCDANGAYDVLDFLCYQGLFTDGCP